MNNWKTSAHKKFEYLEKSGSLIPDYVMSNGLPEVFPNNDASPSIQARPTWQCPDDRPDCTSRSNFILCSITDPAYFMLLKVQFVAEFGQRHPILQQNGFSLAVWHMSFQTMMLALPHKQYYHCNSTLMNRLCIKVDTQYLPNFV